MPFDIQSGHSHRGGAAGCPVFKLLPPPLQRESEAHEFLLDYIHLLPIDEVGIPEYYTELDRGLGDIKDPNLIYPIGDGLYVHIYPDLKDSRNYYIAIEPGMFFDSGGPMEDLENLLVDYVDELDDLDGAQKDRARVLGDILKKACLVVKQKDLKREQSKAKEKNGSRLPVTRSQLESLRYRLVRDKEGMGVLEPLVQDPYIEDISCSGTGPMFLEHKIFKGLKTSINFSSMEELDAFVIQMSEKLVNPSPTATP